MSQVLLSDLVIQQGAYIQVGEKDNRQISMYVHIYK